MNGIQMSPQDLKNKIENHFRAQGVDAELQTRLIARSGKRINSVVYKGRFCGVENVEFGFKIPFDGTFKPTVNTEVEHSSRIFRYLVSELDNAVKIS